MDNRRIEHDIWDNIWIIYFDTEEDVLVKELLIVGNEYDTVYGRNPEYK